MNSPSEQLWLLFSSTGTKVLAVAFVEPIMRDQELFKNDQQWQKHSPTLDRSYMCSAMRRVVRFVFNT